MNTHRKTFYQKQLEGVEISLEEIPNTALTGKLVVSVSISGKQSTSNVTGQWSFHTYI